ncbi:hypothetical protein AA313_de0203183 [Arthrobotrys entomopaga]|nr:hypothetical protein AA313_de0203183 [Arthrobotrys entomopaga]
MPVSTRHSAAAATTAGQQTKLNFSSKKNVAGKPIKPITHEIPFREPKSDENLAESRIDVQDKEEDKALPAGQEEAAPDAFTAPKQTLIEEEEEGREDVLEEQDQVDDKFEEPLFFQEQIIERPKFDISFIGKDRTDEAYLITPQQIKAYYTSIRNSRIGPPIHQEGLTDYEKILRHFDLSSQYGPCVGGSRFKRWNRADRFGLEPPMEVLAVLLKCELAENVEPPPKDWKPAPANAREDVGSVAYINTLLDTHTKE